MVWSQVVTLQFTRWVMIQKLHLIAYDMLHYGCSRLKLLYHGTILIWLIWMWVCILHRWLFASTFSPSLFTRSKPSWAHCICFKCDGAHHSSSHGRRLQLLWESFLPLPLSSLVLLWLLRVGVQAVFGACDVVVFPEGLVQLVYFRHERQTNVQVHLQIL